MITERLDALITPARNEIRLAQAAALERIQQVLRKAETEVADEGRFMTAEQRLQAAEKELAETEEHLLSALKSMFKAFCYVVPQMNMLIDIQPIKELKAIVVSDPVQEAPAERKRSLFNRKKFKRKKERDSLQ